MLILTCFELHGESHKHQPYLHTLEFVLGILWEQNNNMFTIAISMVATLTVIITFNATICVAHLQI